MNGGLSTGMAKFLSPTFGTASGSVAGVTYTKTGTMRMRATPANPQTARQQANRVSFAQSSAQWRQLTPGQRQAWVDAALQDPLTDPLGTQFFLTGAQYYTRTQQNLASALLAPTLVPKAKPGWLPSQIISAIVIAAGTIELTVAVAKPTDYRLLLDFTAPLSTGRAPSESQFRRCGVASTALVVGTPFPCTAIYTSVFGALPPNGTIIYGRFTQAKDGYTLAPGQIVKSNISPVPLVLAETASRKRSKTDEEASE